VVLHLLCAGLVYAFARRRTGPFAALVPAIALLFLGTAWEVVVQLALIVFLLPLAAGLGALLALERRDLPGDLAAAACLLVALASGSLGVTMAIGAAVAILLQPRPIPRLGRVLAGPLALYAAWAAAYGESRVLDQWTDLPRLLVHYPAANVAGLAGFSFDAAPALWVALVALLACAVAYAIARRLGDWRTLVVLTAMTAVYWTAVALFRPEFQELPSRYVYPGAAFLLLILTCLYGRRPARPALGVAAALGLVLLVASQAGDLRDGARRLDRRAEFLGPSLGALELERGHVAGDFRPEPTRAPDVIADRYFAAVAAYGSPADSPVEIASRPEEARRAADIVSTRALGLRFSGITRDEFRRDYGGCRKLALGGPGARRELVVPRPGVALLAPAGSPLKVRLRRFAAGYGPDEKAPGERFFPLSTFRPLLTPLVLVLFENQAAELRIPADRTARPWHVGLSGSGTAHVCAARP
jgi:hypothetical protein